MAKPNDALRDKLSSYRQINLSIRGRKSGRSISRPVWFVLDSNTLYLLPVHGSDTEWYKNVLEDRKIQVEARGSEAGLEAIPITDATQVKSVVEKFREKYGANDVKKYYSKFDVAVCATLQD